MKIKSVKITGFRAFEKEEDSTFDFMKDGVIMNFASIYAPNGFGKTSFYDAIEWGVTHKIQRFDRMVDFEKVRKENVAPILLNKASKTGKVSIETNKDLFENVINNRKKYDPKAKANNEYFKDQILTQDLIDAFLKEEKADKRYENFLEIDENLKKNDAAYKKIIRLLEYIKDDKKDVDRRKKEQEKKLQGEIDFEEEFKKFDELNEVIILLNNENESLNLIDQKTFNETIYENLSRHVDIRLLVLKDELEKAKIYIDSIALARDGSISDDGKFTGGILSYLENKSKVEEYDKQIINLKQIIEWLDEQDKINTKLKDVDLELRFLQTRVDRVTYIEKELDNFHTIRKDIDNLQKDIAGFNEVNISTNLEMQSENLLINDIDLKIADLKKNTEDNQSKLNNIPTLQKQLDSSSRLILLSQQKHEQLLKDIDKEQNKGIELKLILDEFGYYENKIKDDIEVLTEFKLFANHRQAIINYVDDEKKLENLKKENQEIQVKIDNQNQFQRELSEFINAGLEIANRSQSSDCPLCNQRFDTFDKLSENILSNKSLDSHLLHLMKEKANSDLAINNLISKLVADKEKIVKFFNEFQQPYQSDYKNTQIAIEKLDSERKANLEKLDENQAILKEIILLLEDLNTFDELSVKLEKELLNTKEQLLELSLQRKKSEEAVLEKNLLIKLTQQKIISSEQNLLKHQTSDLYVRVRDYLIEEFNNHDLNKLELVERISSINLKIKDLKNNKENQNKSLDELKVKLANYVLSREEYIKRINHASDNKSQFYKIYKNYENYIRTEFDVEINDKEKSQIEKVFKALISNQKKFQELIEGKIENYRIITILNAACNKATESKKIQDNINFLEKNLIDLEVSEQMLNDEKENLKLYLKSSIESYFYSPLINAIYMKIDPHPDYKSIEFECDFAENKPRLQIFTTTVDKGKTEKFVPSLYFSTAQVNILSLSIFLARALKTKDDKGESVDCIFIDDPIQSMDSINILSFIDLFRGITLSLDKQLIVSTHEENFHLLLKKKIPSDLFKSKFLEFETFGKLKKS